MSIGKASREHQLTERKADKILNIVYGEFGFCSFRALAAKLDTSLIGKTAQNYDHHDHCRCRRLEN